MDTEVLNSLPDCKDARENGKKTGRPCQWWYDIRGVCCRPANIDCPQGVRQPRQEVAETEYTILG